MTPIAAGSSGTPLTSPQHDSGADAASAVPEHDEMWTRNAGRVRLLSWVSLGWMTLEGAVGIAAGVSAASIALIGWALSSVVEGAASVIVIWRFTGTRLSSETAETRAQKAIAVSFWVLAPYLAVASVRDLITRHEAGTTVVGIILTAASLAAMPALGLAKHKLGAQLGSKATAGEGTQNLLCAYLAAAVLVGLVANSAFGWWWLDPIVGLLVAAVAIREGMEAWRGHDCC